MSEARCSPWRASLRRRCRRQLQDGPECRAERPAPGTEGIESALEQGRAAAGEKEVSLGGGASVAQQYLAAGLLDEIVVSVVPIVLGGGARLFEKLGDVKLEQVDSVGASGVTHIRYVRA